MDDERLRMRPLVKQGHACGVRLEGIFNACDMRYCGGPLFSNIAQERYPLSDRQGAYSLPKILAHDRPASYLDGV